MISSPPRELICGIASEERTGTSYSGRGRGPLLRLKRVEIQGFKSFFDKTEMRFNGYGHRRRCGTEWLREVATSAMPSVGCWASNPLACLRGTRMEDVIFAGTRDRKPLGMAAGHHDPGRSGHLSTGTRTAHNGHRTARRWRWLSGEARHHKPQDITITRRLFRTGESEYLINGNFARLRDIQDLFIGTGLGPESYAIIEQGRIGQILSNKPAGPPRQ